MKEDITKKVEIGKQHPQIIKDLEEAIIVSNDKSIKILRATPLTPQQIGNHACYFCKEHKKEIIWELIVKIGDKKTTYYSHSSCIPQPPYFDDYRSF